jgi:hypothetical protein
MIWCLHDHPVSAFTPYFPGVEHSGDGDREFWTYFTPQGEQALGCAKLNGVQGLNGVN